MKVLLIDDSLVFRKAQAKAMKSLGIETIYEAENGKIAIASLEKINYEVDLILLDINMPVMSGIETLQIIRQRAPDLPVIMCTSEAGKEKIMQAIKAGATTYLLKPIRKIDILEKINKYVSQKT